MKKAESYLSIILSFALSKQISVVIRLYFESKNLFNCLMPSGNFILLKIECVKFS